MAQIEQLRQDMNVRAGYEWDPLEGLADPRGIRRFLDTVPFNTSADRRLTSPPVRTIGPQYVGTGPTSTQAAFGRILDAIAKTDSDLARRIVTTSPDVTFKVASDGVGRSPPLSNRTSFSSPAITRRSLRGITGRPASRWSSWRRSRGAIRCRRC